MNKPMTITTVVIAGAAFIFVQGNGLGQLNDLSPSTIAASASATANSSISTAFVTVYNTTTDDPIEIVAPLRDGKSQV